jgi:hypothetical protein
MTFTPEELNEGVTEKAPSTLKKIGAVAAKIVTFWLQWRATGSPKE